MRELASILASLTAVVAAIYVLDWVELGRVIRLSSFGSSLLRSLAAPRFNPARKENPSAGTERGDYAVGGKGVLILNQLRDAFYSRPHLGAN